jgi:hypothetical protein
LQELPLKNREIRLKNSKQSSRTCKVLALQTPYIKADFFNVSQDFSHNSAVKIQAFDEK